LLDQETRSYRRHGTLLSAERLAVIEPHEQELRFSADAEMLLRESQNVVRQEQLARERRRRIILGSSVFVALITALLALWGFTSSQAARKQANPARVHLNDLFTGTLPTDLILSEKKPGLY
jgi:hypothetical protein